MSEEDHKPRTAADVQRAWRLPNASKRQREEMLRAATSAIIAEFGMGDFSSAKRKSGRNSGRHAHRRGGNPVFAPAVPAQRQPEQRQSVYVIGSAGGAIKIGIAADPWQRLSDLQVGSAQKLTLHYMAKVDEPRAIERACHKALRDHSLNGEWFAVAADTAIATVRRVASEFGYSRSAGDE